MPAPPLTHHEILGLAEPFARRGYRVDLAASDRAARRLVFKPAEATGGPAPQATPEATATLTLDCRDGGRFGLTRTLTGSGGLQATLQVAGTSPQQLLTRIEAVPPAHHFRQGPGYVVARSYQLPTAEADAEAEAGTGRLVLGRGVVAVDGLRLTLNVLDVRGAAGDLVLTPLPAGAMDLPEDLLAVLGWHWARLVPNPTGWTSRVRLRGRGARRTQAAEAALDRAAQHLAQVMAEPPIRFHQRHWRARWGVVLRRGIPSLTAIGLVAGSLLLPRLTGQQQAGLWMALHYVPIALLALSFTLQELARFEIPPLPRRPRSVHWRQKAAGPTAAVPPTGPREV